MKIVLWLILRRKQLISATLQDKSTFHLIIFPGSQWVSFFPRNHMVEFTVNNLLKDIVGTYISDHSVFPATTQVKGLHGTMSETIDVEQVVECTRSGQVYMGLNVTMVGKYRYKSGSQTEQSCSKRGTVAIIYFTPE